MDSKLKKMARIGYVAKGLVYGITGALTLLAALNLGGQLSGGFKVMDFLEKQPFGNILLVIIALGLVCYVIWRFIQAFKDPENIGTDTRAKAKRGAFFISGLIYLGLAAYAILRLFNAVSSSSSGSGSSGGKLMSFLTGPAGIYIFAIIGVSLIGTSIYQFRKTYTGKFLDKFNYKSISEEKRRKTIKNTGYLGHISRGIIFGIMSYFFIRAAVKSNTTNIKTTSDAFSFLESTMGSWLMGLVAAGLICYAIYMFMMARYRKFQD